MKTVSTLSGTPAHEHAAAAQDLPPRDVLHIAGDLLRALAAPVRIAIVLQLRESARCVHDLVDALEVPQPLVSQHRHRGGRGHPRRRGRPVSTTGVRATRQRAAISALLENLEDFRSAQELHDELRRRGEGIGLTTVYRTLQSMAANGLVDTLRTDTGESVYRRCSDDHHHHLVCRVCGCTVEIQGGDVEAWAAQVAREHGFSEVSHTIEIFGVCGDCAGK
jgi:Fur family ferric uptake transcriptional regulator